MKKVLIVDDAKFMQKVTSDMLSSRYQTFCASSGREALELYEREKPDLILTDLLMPGMTGLELQRILMERYGEQVPIMFMTADEREENESRSLAGGALDYIRKPFNRDVLLRRVDNIIRNMERISNLKMVAETDYMTGLLNKSHSQRRMKEICTKASGRLMMVDLDSFKLVNDLYGHNMGDRILIRFADIIRGVIRASDTAGRIGGDEFMIFCRDIRDEEVIRDKVKQMGDQIRASAVEFMGEDMNIPLGVSVGAVIVPDEGREFLTLFEKADKALYNVKRNGKHGCEFFHAETAAALETETKSSAGSIEGIRMILEERNRNPGAYALSFENFRVAYRYMARMNENYHRAAELLVFTLHCRDPRWDAAEAFGEVLRTTLRRSDVYTESGKSQFLVLLAEMEGKNDQSVLARIMDHWNREACSAGCTLDYESYILTSDKP